uniref:Reverse transcriptase domain-containing protein n=1 Tax=Oreochromis niloticus TaxID=8128 RepID=A0A669B359_ORENI
MQSQYPQNTNYHGISTTLKEKNKTVHMAFLDLEKAFDRVPHDLIWHSLRSHGVPEAYIKWIQLLYDNATINVRFKLKLYHAENKQPFNFLRTLQPIITQGLIYFNIIMW